MVRFEDLRIFVAAADHGSFSAAARELDLTPAVASAALKRLELTLETRLFVRSTRMSWRPGSTLLVFGALACAWPCCWNCEYVVEPEAGAR